MVTLFDIFSYFVRHSIYLSAFLKILNSCHTTIKFAAEHSLDKVNFLDVEVIRGGNKLLTDLYDSNGD